jgi:hypothetical protein
MSPDEGCFPADFSLASRVDMQKVVATCELLYGGSAPTPVRIVQLDYDFWYEIGAGNWRTANVRC